MPPQVTENRPNSKVFLFVTYSLAKMNDWTPPWDPPRSPREVPKPTRGAPENHQSSPRALQDPQDALGITKPMENQQKSKENHIKRIRTIENQTEYKETFKNLSDERLHLHVTGHLPTKR